MSASIHLQAWKPEVGDKIWVHRVRNKPNSLLIDMFCGNFVDYIIEMSKDGFDYIMRSGHHVLLKDIEPYVGQGTTEYIFPTRKESRMNGQEALTALLEGKKVCRKCWNYYPVKNSDYLYNEGGHIFRTYSGDSKALYFQDINQLTGLLTSDWEIYEELHDWNWALEQLTNGKSIQWKDDDPCWFAYIRNGTIYLSINPLNYKPYPFTDCHFKEFGWSLYEG